MAQGNRRGALESYRAAVNALPDYPLAHYNLGTLLHTLGDLDGALIHCRKALQLDPTDIDAHFNLGNVYQARGDASAAAECYRHMLQVWPNNGLALNNLGNVLAAQGDKDQALVCYRAAVTASPDFGAAHYNLGTLLQERGEISNALFHCRRAAQLDAGDADCHFRLGCVCDQLNEVSAAVASYERTVELNPQHARAHTNLGLLLLNAREPLTARACFDRAITADSSYPKAHLGRAMVDLSLGDWQRGWEEYEWRLQIDTPAVPASAGPRWNGEPLAGARILLFDEQGLGDAMQFVRYVPVVAAQGAQVLLRVRPALRRLFATLPGIAGLSTFDEPLPEFDFQCPLLSIPRALRSTIDTVPADVPYLSADGERVREWSRRLGPDGFKIGICWRGGPKKPGVGRSFALHDLRGVASIPSVRLISLQKDDSLEDFRNLPVSMKVERLDADFDAGPDAFLDTAAVMQSLDLIITCDTSIAHLAGALGRPTWVALQRTPDWRWMLDRDSSPWYPTVRLFRQTTDGQWGDVFDAICESLHATLEHLPLPRAADHLCSA
jgi:tetratricopeptide (TPR) repeat protein